ncbi:MAG TPA: hypothetical protein P5055_13655 [Candidatus Paceibacterota bacterium]|nr:hypothetical protein [Verrucomicrobiota bacterium]HSA01775.1 hypothetical protein [Candidatus Paceibacterota bacterium]
MCLPIGWVLCGCVSHPTDLYPIGIYGAQKTNDLPSISRAGFSLVAGPANRSYLNAAQQNGLRVLASPHTTAGAGFSPGAAARAVQQLDGHPALWAWYLADEPDLNLVSPEAVNRAHRELKSVPAQKPTAVVLHNAPNALYYAHTSDILMIDRYPIPWLPLANFGQHVRQTRLALGPAKPLIAVIQAFDWSYYPEIMTQESNLRPPNHAELRCMTYLALAHQATGLFYYTFDDGRWRIDRHVETWQALRQVVIEIRQREPLFTAEHQWWPYRHNFGNWSNRFNRALESSITPAWLRVRRGNAWVPPGNYLLLVNNTELDQRYRITIPVPALESLPVLGEDRSVRLTKDWLQDDFGAYAVHVYGPFS